MQVIDGRIQFTLPEDHFCAILWQVLPDDIKDKMISIIRESRGKIPMAAINLTGLIIPGSQDGTFPRQ